MAAKPLPPAGYLRQRLRYEPETGKLYWREFAGCERRWNSRYAGTEAFTATNGKGYRMGRIDGAAYQAHRVAWAMHYGSDPEGQIDHINHNRQDNRADNLRDVASGINQKNMSRPRTNTSGVVGVYWYARHAKWMASIKAEGTLIYLGYFADKADAVAARKAAEARYGFHVNHGVEAPQSNEAVP